MGGAGGWPGAGVVVPIRTLRSELAYRLLADGVLGLHAAVVAFVIAGLVLVIIGNLFGWDWVNRLWFRLAHLGTIAFVVVQSWFGFTCPLTTLERWLRVQAGATADAGGFIEYWLQRILFYQAPAWVFVTGYTLFGLCVAAAWVVFPPHAGLRHNAEESA